MDGKCVLKNRIAIVQSKLEEIYTHCENLAEAGISMAQNPELGSPYEGARMLHAFTKVVLMVAGDPNIDYDIVEFHMKRLHDRVKAYIDLHNGLAILSGLTSDWTRMADLLDLSKDLVNVKDINVPALMASDPSPLNLDRNA